MATPDPNSIAVIGGGITGLTAAARLAAAGRAVRLFEAGDRLGGAVRTERCEGYLIEAGPNSLLESSPVISAWLRELGLENEIVVANPLAKKRCLVRRGRLYPLPLSPPALLATRLFSPRAKLRLLSELRRRPAPRAADVPLAQLVREHFGQELVDYALNPFVAGVYAGDPEKLSARHAFPQLWEMETRHGSLLRAQAAAAKARPARHEPPPRLISFRRGLQTLIDALASRLPAGALELNARVESLTPGASWRVRWTRAGQPREETFSRIVLALPAPALAELELGGAGRRPLAALAAIEHPPVTSLFLGFRREQVAHPLDGFGLLVPAVERRAILGVLFSSALFPDRAPAGCVALTVMVGGSRQPELAARPLAELLPSVLPDLREFLGVRGEPVFTRQSFWPRAIPQYALGYGRFLDAMSACETAHPGLFIGGQARGGISLPACILSGLKLAENAGA